MSEKGKRDTEITGYSVGEEIFNAVTHGIGVIVAVVGLVVMILKACRYGEALHVVSVTIFGSSMVILYLASTLYHSITNKGIKAALKVIDHSSIFLLIAGTYTPFTLITLRGPWGWSIFGAVWGFALLGIIVEVLRIKKGKVFSLVLYLLMGWIVVVAIVPLVKTLPGKGLFWLISGGLAYTLGVVFYVMKQHSYTHGVWHLFVLMGTISHFVAIYLYVLPSA